LVRVSAHQDSAIELTMLLWVHADDYWTVYYCMMEHVKKAFDAAGISIPYPQIVLHSNEKSSVCI
jgi:small conductance mechanosensitive channel